MSDPFQDLTEMGAATFQIINGMPHWVLMKGKRIAGHRRLTEEEVELVVAYMKDGIQKAKAEKKRKSGGERGMAA